MEIVSFILYEIYYDSPIYEFIAVFVCEFAPILAQIVLILIAVKRNWNDLYENPMNFKDPELKLKLNPSTALRKSYKIAPAHLLPEDESEDSSNEIVHHLSGYRQSDPNKDYGTLFAQRSHYLSAEFAFDQGQRFQLSFGQQRPLEGTNGMSSSSAHSYSRCEESSTEKQKSEERKSKQNYTTKKGGIFNKHPESQ